MSDKYFESIMVHEGGMLVTVTVRQYENEEFREVITMTADDFLNWRRDNPDE